MPPRAKTKTLPDPDVLDRDGVAELLRVSVRLVDYAVENGTIPPPVKISPGTLRWSRTGLLNWLAGVSREG